MNVKELYIPVITIMCSLVPFSGSADDTDIFLGKNATGAQGVTPSNIFFLLDTSSSMSWKPATDPDSTEIKMDILKDAMNDILSVKGDDDTLRNINIGIGTFYSPAGLVSYPILPVDGVGVNGGLVRNEVLDFVNGLGWANSWGTPLASAYYESLSYMLGRPVLFGESARDYGNYVELGYRGEERSHPATYDGSVPPNYNFQDIVNQSCATNSIILLSDGQATVSGYDDMVANDPGTMNELALDANDGQPCDATWGIYERCGREFAGYAFNRTDTTEPDAPPIFTHTIGFDIEADSAAESYLQDVANQGGGQYFRAANRDQLINAFLNITNRVVEETSAFSPPVVPANIQNRLYSASNVYLNLFATERKPIWQGNIKKFGVCEPDDTGCVPGQYLGAGDQVAVDDDGNLLTAGVGDIWDTDSDPSAADVLSGGIASKIGTWETRTMYTWTGVDYPGTIDSSTNVSDRGWPLYEIDKDKEILAGGVEPDLATTNDVAGGDGRLRKRLFQSHGHCDANGAIESQCMDTLVKFLLGGKTRDTQVDGFNADNRWPIADLMHSEMQVIPYGETADGERISKIVFGTNDGGLHVHDAKTGAEHFTIYPQEVLDRLADLEGAEDGSEHIYGLDGSASVRIRDNNRDFTIDPSDGDFVHIYIGMRRGGYQYYAFNLTPDTALTNHSDGPGDPELLWVIKGTEDASDPFYRLGQTWSKPRYSSIVYKDGDSSVSRPVLIFGGGYDPDVEDVDGSFGPVPATGSNLGNAIYIVDADTGEALWWASGDFEASAGVSGLQVADMKASFVGDINLVDSNNDRRTDRLYAADLMGQVWRVDLNADLTKNSVGRLAVLSESGDPTNPEDNTDERKFFYEPDFVRLHDAKFSSSANGNETYDVVALVSGNRANPVNSTTTNRAYVLRDYLDDEAMMPLGSSSPTNFPRCNAASTAGCSSSGSITNDGLFDASTSIVARNVVVGESVAAQQLANKNGYYFDLSSDSELGFSRTQVLDGTMYFTTYETDDGPSIKEEIVDGVTQCKVELGAANLYVVDLESGSPVLTSGSESSADNRSFLIGKHPVTRAVPVINPSETGGSLLRATLQSGTRLPPDPNAKELSFYPTFWYQQ